MKRKKICVVVHSRANYGRSKSILKAIEEHPKLELQLIVGASALLWRFGEAIKVIKKDGFRPIETIHMMLEGETPLNMAKSTGLGIIELSSVFDRIKPDFVLTVADRYETMSTAIAASYMNIPLVHTQGGEVTGSIDESVRHAITKLSHLHFPATEQSKKRIIKMGENPEYVFNTGCPSIDLISNKSLGLENFSNQSKGLGNLNLDEKYILVLQHPVTSEYGDGSKQIKETINAIHELKIQTIWLWPNIDAGTDDFSKALRIYREQKKPNFVNLYRNFSPEDYAILLKNSACTVGNSSSFIREGCFLGVPSVIIGSRQNKRESGKNVVRVNYSKEEIISAIKKQLFKKFPQDKRFGSGDAGKKMTNILSKIEINTQKILNY